LIGLRNCALEASRTEEDGCPAGLGLVVEAGHILHICPRDSGRSLVHYHFPKRGLFGLRTPESRTWEEVSSEEVERMIDHLFGGNYEAIAEMA
jgi:hypothetical protein